VDLRQHLEEELEKDFQLLKQYENEKRNENDPGLCNKLENRIQSIKQVIEKRQEELNKLPKSSPNSSSNLSILIIINFNKDFIKKSFPSYLR
jgi:hypothetical protein